MLVGHPSHKRTMESLSFLSAGYSLDNCQFPILPVTSVERWAQCGHPKIWWLQHSDAAFHTRKLANCVLVAWTEVIRSDFFLHRKAELKLQIEIPHERILCFFSQKIQFIGKAARAIWRRCHVHDCPVALQHWPQSGGTGGSWEQVGMPVEGRPHQVQEVGVACHFDERSEWLSRLNLWQTSSWSFFSPPKPRKTYAPKSGWKQSSPFLGSVEYNIWSFTAWLTIFGGGILTGPREKYEINSSLLLLMVQIAKTRTPVLDF